MKVKEAIVRLRNKNKMVREKWSRCGIPCLVMLRREKLKIKIKLDMVLDTIQF